MANAGKPYIPPRERNDRIKERVCPKCRGIGYNEWGMKCSICRGKGKVER